MLSSPRCRYSRRQAWLPSSPQSQQALPLFLQACVLPPSRPKVTKSGTTAVIPSSSTPWRDCGMSVPQLRHVLSDFLPPVPPLRPSRFSEGVRPSFCRQEKRLPSDRKSAKESRQDNKHIVPPKPGSCPLPDSKKPRLRAEMNAERPSFPKRKEGLSGKFSERRTYASGSKSSGKSALVYTFCTSSSSSRASVRRTSFLAVSASTGTSMRGTMAS